MAPSPEGWSRFLKQGLARLSADAAPCHTECRSLMALAEAIVLAEPVFAPAFESWREKAQALLADEYLESLDGEARLEALSMELRSIWLGLAHRFSDPVMKSPPHTEDVRLPFGGVIRNYIYERVLPSRILEKKLDARLAPVDGWESRICLFASAMGALTVLLQVLPRFLSAKGETPRWDSHVGYYETDRLLRLHDRRGVYCRRYQEPDELFQRLAEGKSDIVMLEPSMYDWNQTVLDPRRVIDAILARPKSRPLALVMDSTLLGPQFSMPDLLAMVEGSCPLLAIDLRSGLKLDQEGLELSNVGIARLFTREGESAAIHDAERWHLHMRSARKIFGNALSLDEMAILDAPWFSDPPGLAAYAEPIFANNARMAAALATVNGLFARIAHPSLTERAGWKWAESPFVIAHFRDEEDSRENRDFLQAVMLRECEKRGLTVRLGSSFGFRHHRFEIVVPDGYERPDGSKRGFLKIAMGHRAGPSLNGFMALMQEIAAIGDFPALRNAYPDLSAQSLPESDDVSGPFQE